MAILAPLLKTSLSKPGKGQAFNRVKIRNLKTGRMVEKTFKSGDSVAAADVLDIEMQYLYSDGEFWAFYGSQYIRTNSGRPCRRGRFGQMDERAG